MPENKTENTNVNENDNATGGAEDNDNENTGVKGGKETVSKAEFDKVLSDMHKYKKAAKDSEKQASEEKTRKLKEANDWKALAEQHESDAKAAKTEAEETKTAFYNEKKFNAVRSECEKLGLRQEAIDDLDSLDLKAIQVETTSTGRLNVLGAENFAKRLKTLKPHWFDGKKNPKVNTTSGGINNENDDGSGAVTVDQILLAEKEGKKSGDLRKYTELTMRFQKQQAQARMRM